MFQSQIQKKYTEITWKEFLKFMRGQTVASLENEEGRSEMFFYQIDIINFEMHYFKGLDKNYSERIYPGE